MMVAGKTFQTDWELDIARTNDILDLELLEFGIEPELLNDTSIFAGGEFAIVLGFGA